MRLGALAVAAIVLAIPALAVAQEYVGTTGRASGSVIRPASTAGWRNYVAVPDGPCGHPMSVQADCYVGCRPCGPLRPFCFLHRVGRMLDCLIPCNLCCRSGCGPLHGCVLGGKSWGCNVCCGAPARGTACGCAHPCGSAFDSCSAPACTTGGHCYGCSDALPGLSNPFQDDPLPPKPTADSATEVRRVPARPARPVAAPARVTTAATRATSPYKIVAAPDMSSRLVNRAASGTTATKKPTSQPVLRRASAEQTYSEPAALKIDHSRAAPIVRSQSPEAEASYKIPSNPLR